MTLTLSETNLTGNEIVSEWVFSFDPGFTLGNLVFSAPTKIGNFNDPVISTGTDSFAVTGTGTGSYDIRFAFFTTGNNANKHFGVGESVEYTITSTDAINVDSFDFAPSGGHRRTAAGIDGLGFIAVPEPATLALVVLGALAMAPHRRRWRA